MAFLADILATSPWLHWRLGESSGTVAEDATANNRDGTISGDITLGTAGSISGDPDTAVTSGGTNGLIIGPAFNSVNYTFAVRLKLTSLPIDNASVVATSNGLAFGNNNREIFVKADGRVGSRIWDGSVEIFAVSSTTLTLGQWYYIFAVEDGTNITLYIDGTQAAQVATGGTADNVTFHAAGVTGYSLARLAAAFDEISVWDSALSSGTITSLVASAAAGGAPAGSVRVVRSNLRLG